MFKKIALGLSTQAFAFWLGAQSPIAYQHPIPFEPKQYVCYRSAQPLQIDGKLDEAAWQRCPWTEDFQDIEGSKRPAPTWRTRTKMLWDDQFLYIAAELEEPHLWGTLTTRDAVIFQDDDFEVFIDPDGNGVYYAELEVNALNTVWDLLLFAPYHLNTSPTYTNHWDIHGLKTAVQLQGSLNNPGDTDKGWILEIALPLPVLAELTESKKMPVPGAQWRINFSRVDWQMEHSGQHYTKKINPATQRPFPESNWVWSPTGRIDMHRPETWGWLQFSGIEAGSQTDSFRPNPAMPVQWGLWQLFYAQRTHRQQFGNYATSLNALQIPGSDGFETGFSPVLSGDANRFQIQATDIQGNTWSISEAGRLQQVFSK